MVQRLCQVFCPASVCEISIRRVISEELFLLPESLLHRQPSIDILLTPIDNPNKPKLQRIRPSRQDIQRVRPGIHQIELGENPNRSQASRIDGSRKFERVRVGNVLVCGRNGEDDCVGL